ncbi:MAG: MotA/TolQ/ExbB proton channel family protein [Bacteroidaceae bacterium]|nr:MotA/TolQ/ExbB proton channel family protein [Bacteroidaceae bacterium]MBQ3238649.1 MotA/TolQ/ExbB proton channel family protein [Bacteroidaceae bacterium]MBQ7967679.1 MotA/TolQ/ExbB proton channel family protein [Bacteroidaceae bacterium]MBR3985269.1 MotA/TolQ/ExbB proton channel family protein [Bacteroidaceae bacterium]
MLLLQAQVEQAVTEVAENPVLTEVVEAANEMNLWDMAVKGGWIMIVLALLSVLSIYIFVERLMAIRKASKVDPVFMERIRDYVKTDELKSAINYCRVAGTPAANMIEKGIERIDRPAAEVQAALENAGNLEIAKLEKGLSVMATISSGAPMIGFLGTVLGMVKAFWEMANAGNNIDITLLSSGIYEAMITTVGGLIVGIIAMFAYNYLVSRVDDVANSLEAQTLAFMDLKN